VGIGTASPDYMLHVSKTQNSTTGILAENTSGNTAAQAGLLARNDGGALASLTVLGSAYPSASYYAGNDALLTASAGKLILRTLGNHPMLFVTNNAEEMRLTAAGNLGIGNTNPGAMLHIGSLTPTILANPGGIWIAPNLTFAMLHMKNSVGQEGGIMLHSNSNTYVGNWTNHDLILRTNNTDRITIEAGGNVGIGDTTPTFKLDVNGTLRAVGLMSANAGISFGDETLSTYDEGNYSPVLQAASGSPTATYSTQVGWYTKIGNFVVVMCNLTWSGLSGGTGSAYVTLPFTSRGGSVQVFTGTGPSNAMIFQVGSSDNRATIAPASAVPVTIAAIGASGTIRFVAVYYCA
jgi:hypothetical protein